MREQDTCSEAPAMGQQKAYSSIGGGLRAATESMPGEGLRKQLYERQYRLQRELQEIQDALTILETDESVKKVLKVFEVAQKG